MLAWLIGIGLSVGFRLLPFGIGLRFWNRYDRGEKAIVVLMGYDAIGIIVGAFLAYYFQNNLITSNIYTVVEVALMTLFFQRFLHDPIAKKLLNWFPLVFGVGVFISSVFFIGIHESNFVGNAFSCLFLILLSVMGLGYISGEDDNLIKQGYFWILIAIFVHYLLNIGYLTMHYWAVRTESALTAPLLEMLKYSFYVYNFLIFIGLWLVARNKKQKLIVAKS